MTSEHMAAPGLFVRAGRRVTRWLSRTAGLGAGFDALRVMPVFHPARTAREAGQCLRGNLAGQKAMERADFSRVLEAWGVTPEELSAVRTRLSSEVRAGTGLALFSLAALAAQVWFAPPLLWLAAPACVSMALAGLVMALAAAWRRAVLLRRRFVPFVRWLVTGFAGQA